MSCFVGIDGGGSSTRVLLARSDGVILGSGTAAGSNVYDLGVERASGAIFAALDQAFSAAGEKLPVCSCFAGVAGAGVAALAGSLRDRLAEHLKLDPSRCVVDRDVRNAHAGALAGSAGAVLIAGTGSVCFGRTNDGRAATAGGWGTLIDDPGSGSWFGLRGMGAIVRAADGRGPKTTLTKPLFEHLQVDSPSAMLARWRGSSIDRHALAALAPLVLDAAEHGDASAKELAERGARELANMVAAVRTRLAIKAGDRWPVVPAGGLIQASAFFRERIVDAIVRTAPETEIGRPILPPSGGSLLLALELGGVKPSSAIIEQIKTAL